MSGPSLSNVGVVITAAGASRRFGGDKLAAQLGDRSVLRRSIDAFAQRDDVAEIVVAISAELAGDSPLGIEIARLRSRLHAKIRFVAAGGASRAETVSNAIRTFEASCEWIAVHDGARPLVSQELIDRVFFAGAEHGAAAPAMPLTATIKLAGSNLPSVVERTIPRSTLWAMQTPQVMRRVDLLDAIAACPLPRGEVTDDCQLLELAGRQVTLVRGDERNLKITTKLDLELARLLLEGVTP